METGYLRFAEEDFFPDELFAAARDNELQTLSTEDVSTNVIDVEHMDYNLEETIPPSFFTSIFNDANSSTDMLTTVDNTLPFEEILNKDSYVTQWPNQVETWPQVATWAQSLWDCRKEPENLSISNMNLLQESTSPIPQMKVKEEEQKDVNIKKESTFGLIHDTEQVDIKIKAKQEIEVKKVDIKIKAKQEIEVKKVDRKITPPLLPQKTSKFIKKDANTKNKNQNGKEKRKKKENVFINSILKLEEPEDHIDVETVLSDNLPALEAVDLNSLLEQFEATENSNLQNQPAIKNDRTRNMETNKISLVTKEYSRMTGVPVKSVSQASSHQKDVQTALSKDVIDRIKASGRKKSIPIIPPMPNIQDGNRSNNARTNSTTLSRNKTLKTNLNDKTINNIKDKTFTNTLKHDHDYCSSYSKCSNNKLTKQMSILKSNKKRILDKTKECNNEINSKKQYNLESNIHSTRVKSSSIHPETNINKNSVENDIRNHPKEEIPLKQSHDSNDSLGSVKNVPDNTSLSDKTCPVYQMNIRSALAKSILQSRKKLNDTTLAQTIPKKQQMVSVLKNPPNASQSPFTRNNSNENIVTTTNSLNNEVQNIIIQNIQDIQPPEEVKNPPRKKLNLAEYRSRKNQNCTDSSKTASPTVLVYYHHAFTTTEPIKDKTGNLIWSERNFFLVLKNKSDIKEEQNKAKPDTCNVAVQTNENVFELDKKLSVDVIKKNEESREESTKDGKQKSCERYSRSRSKSRSKNKSRSRSKNRSRSKSRSRNRSRSTSTSRSRSRCRSRDRRRNRSKNRSRSNRIRSRHMNRNRSSTSNSSSRSRNRTRSRSRSRSRRNNTRERTISRRSVSSSSWSSDLRTSTSRYTSSRSRSRSRIRSRSPLQSRFRNRSRSRSKSYSRYYSRSSSSSRSNFGRNKWKTKYSRNSNDYKRDFHRHSRYPNEDHGYQNYRSPLYTYHRPYNGYNEDKQRQVEERRVVYVGQIAEGITKADLRRRFEVFGPVVDISIHFRERGYVSLIIFTVRFIYLVLFLITL
ncbi:protein PF14_0175-like [Pogonomyrmex barbatus]|uniref:Protein PF14_0175-like n=1 Tax=Pogonomyrmex barbatus TaxID=144034 RepID=A0A8N1S4G0_9HYME|nr:protein PF14_0175-like [Pogonomyrmex barbatus]